MTVGQSTRIQLASFDNQPNITTATFVLVNGKMRFAVAHPSGAKANYTFQTQTGQIAVRGTEGDISSDATQLQVNVYSLGDPNLPVEVTLNNGKHYTLGAGQALVVGVTGAVIAAAAVSSVIVAAHQHLFGIRRAWQRGRSRAAQPARPAPQVPSQLRQRSPPAQLRSSRAPSSRARRMAPRRRRTSSLRRSRAN